MPVSQVPHNLAANLPRPDYLHLEEHSNKRLRLEKAQKILDCIKKDGNTAANYQETRDLAVKSTIRQIKANLEEIESIDDILESYIEKL